MSKPHGSKRAAELEGRSRSDFVVSAAQDAAPRALENESISRLSGKAQQRFAAALMDPPAPNVALERAVSRRARNIEVR